MQCYGIPLLFAVLVLVHNLWRASLDSLENFENARVEEQVKQKLRTILTETIPETTPKDEEIRQRYHKCEPANSMKNELFVGIKHVKSSPQIEAVDTLADQPVTSA